MDSTAHGRKDRAQEQPLTPPEPGDRAPGTRALWDFWDPKGKSGAPKRILVWPGGWGGKKLKKSEKDVFFLSKKRIFKILFGDVLSILKQHF